MRRNVKHFLFALSLFGMILSFTGGDCGTDPQPPNNTSVAPPNTVKVSVDQASGSFAVITWSHSSDQSRSDFQGYSVVTYRVDSSGNRISIHDSASVDKNSTSYQVSSIVPKTYYRSWVNARASNNLRSDSVATKIYAPVFANSDSVDEYQASGPAKSGYGWNTEFGVGTRYEFTTPNLPMIQIHVRDAGGGLTFYSPGIQLSGGLTTYFGLVGSGQIAFNQTELTEPTSTSIAVVVDNVYLIKTSTNHYIKVWVKQISTNGTYRTVHFNFKVQPIAGLMIVKRKL